MNTLHSPLGNGANALVDSAAETAEQAIRSSQRAAHHAVDSYADGVNKVRSQTGAALDGLASSAEALKHRGMAAMREGSQQVRERSQRAADSTLGYIRDEPAKSVLIAAAVGATLVALVTLFSRRTTR